MRLEYDAGKLAGLAEQELKALHKELTQLEKDAHKARALAWKELTRRRSARISEQTREKGRQARYRAKVRDGSARVPPCRPGRHPPSSTTTSPCRPGRHEL